MLGVKPNVDAKTIKLAYSKLLKKTRPDEDPEGFQRLREAYKTALALAAAASKLAPNRDNGVNVELVQSEKSRDEQPYGDTQGVIARSANTTENGLPPSEADVVAASLEADWSDFIESAERLVELPDKVNSKKDWKELLDSPLLEDLQYRNKASERIFCLVADSRQDKKCTPEEQVNADVMKYMDDEFQWEKRRYKLLARFGSERVDSVFGVLDEQSTDTSFWLVASSGTLLALIVIVCGYFGISFVAVVSVAAVLSTAKRLYVRRWLVKRQGFSNGGDVEFLKGSRVGYVALIFVSMCILEASIYGVGWIIRMIVGHLA